MAILPMRQMTVCALKQQRKPVLELLQRYGTFEPCAATGADEVFGKTETASQRAAFEKSKANANAALGILAQYAPSDTSPFAMLAGRTTLSPEEYAAYAAKNEATLAAVEEILEQNRRLGEYKAENIRLESQIIALEPWLPLTVPTGFTGTKTTTALIGTMPGGTTSDSILAAFAEKQPDLPLDLRLVTERPSLVCVFALCLKRDAAKAEEVLRGKGFVRAAPSKLVPAEEKTQLTEKIAANKSAMEAAKEAIRAKAPFAEDLRFYSDYCAMRIERYGVLGELLQSKHAFFLTGFIPAREADKLAKTLEETFGAAVDIALPDPDAEVPVALSNNGFAAPVESVIESYSMPGKGEFDPTFVMSLFYYLLFGLMLSDAGYGLLMVLGCGICLAKFKNMEPSMKNTLKMFLYCGVSTVFWGVLQGSFFGDIVGVTASTFFGSSVSFAPVWFAPIDDPMRMLVFSLGLGVVHLFCGLAMNIAQHFKNKEYLDALYDGVFWYMLVGGLLVLLMTSSMFHDLANFQLALSPVGMTVLKAVILIGAAGIVLTAGRESKNWFKRILKGLYGLYNVTGYLSDILSYSRLLALGLATGVIATIINKMAGMAAGGGGPIGAIVFILIFLIGHVINMGINLLGAYVHTNRLQFVEFFGKFYNGGGQKFTPFAVHTNYYKLSKEELTNE